MLHIRVWPSGKDKIWQKRLYGFHRCTEPHESLRRRQRPVFRRVLDQKRFSALLLLLCLLLQTEVMMNPAHIYHNAQSELLVFSTGAMNKNKKT